MSVTVQVDGAQAAVTVFAGATTAGAVTVHVSVCG